MNRQPSFSHHIQTWFFYMTGQYDAHIRAAYESGAI